MQIKQNTYQTSFVFFIILLFCSCSKNDDLGINSANYKVSSETIFLDEECTFVAEDTLGKQHYHWDFGDGTLIKDGYKVSHQYTEEGSFITNLSIDGLNYSKTIQVLPGRLSYQIENNSNYYLNVLIYLDNYEAGCTKRISISNNYKSDIIYATSNHYVSGSSMKHSHIFGISIFIENSEYTIAEMFMIDDFKHHTIKINDSTLLIPRSSHGDSKEVMLKDLFPY